MFARLDQTTTSSDDTRKFEITDDITSPERNRWDDIQLALALVLIAIALCALWTAPVRAEGRGTRVKQGEATRVFVMAGFTPECAFIGYPAIQVETAPAKGTVETTDGAETTIQYSLSGKCIGTPIKGTAITYKPAPGQTGEDTFTISGRLGTGEPATRTFSVIIDENGNPQSRRRARRSTTTARQILSSGPDHGSKPHGRPDSHNTYYGNNVWVL